MMIISFYIS